jgi:hypothetical protein
MAGLTAVLPHLSMAASRVTAVAVAAAWAEPQAHVCHSTLSRSQGQRAQRAPRQASIKGPPAPGMTAALITLALVLVWPSPQNC